MTFRQEKPYSCGASAIRNCIESLGGIVPSEKYVRRIAKTKLQGTDEKGIIKALLKLGYSANTFYTENETTFKNRIKKILTQGKKAIVVIQENSHWIAATGYSNKRIAFTDSDYRKPEQHYTLNEFTMICRNIDKINKKTCYFMIVISENIS